MNTKKFPIFIKLILIVYAICFLGGGLRHWVDIINGGLFPYNDVPFIFNFYLTSLAILDFIVIMLLLMRTISGLLLSILIMATDLPVDLYLCNRYWENCSFNANHGLQLLTLFSLFVFISAPIVIFKLRKCNGKYIL